MGEKYGAIRCRKVMERLGSGKGCLRRGEQMLSENAGLINE